LRNACWSTPQRNWRSTRGSPVRIAAAGGHAGHTGWAEVARARGPRHAGRSWRKAQGHAIAILSAVRARRRVKRRATEVTFRRRPGTDAGWRFAGVAEWRCRRGTEVGAALLARPAIVGAAALLALFALANARATLTGPLARVTDLLTAELVRL